MSSLYTDEDFENMVQCYKECGGKVLKVRRLFEARYGIKPSYAIIKQAVSNLCLSEETKKVVMQQGAVPEGSSKENLDSDTEMDHDQQSYYTNSEYILCDIPIKQEESSLECPETKFLDYLESRYPIVYTTRLNDMKIFKEDISKLSIKNIERRIILESKPDLSLPKVWSSKSENSFSSLVQKLQQFNALVLLEREVTCQNKKYESVVSDMNLTKESIELYKICKPLSIPLVDCKYMLLKVNVNNPSNMNINTGDGTLIYRRLSDLDKIKNNINVVMKNLYLKSTEIYYFKSKSSTPSAYYYINHISGEKELSRYINKKTEMIVLINCCWVKSKQNIKEICPSFKIPNIIECFLLKPHQCHQKCTCCCKEKAEVRHKSTKLTTDPVQSHKQVFDDDSRWHDLSQADHGNTQSCINKALKYSRDKKFEQTTHIVKLNNNNRRITIETKNSYELYMSGSGNTIDFSDIQNTELKNACCWHKRKCYISMLSHPTAHLIKEPHRCPESRCSCCCKIKINKRSKPTNEYCLDLELPTDIRHLRNYKSKYIQSWNSIETFDTTQYENYKIKITKSQTKVTQPNYKTTLIKQPASPRVSLSQTKVTQTNSKTSLIKQSAGPNASWSKIKVSRPNSETTMIKHQYIAPKLSSSVPSPFLHSYLTNHKASQSINNKAVQKPKARDLCTLKKTRHNSETTLVKHQRIAPKISSSVPSPLYLHLTNHKAFQSINNKVVQQPKATDLCKILQDPAIQDPEVSALIDNILDKYKNIRLSINDQGKVSANIDTALEKMSTSELKMLASILSHAQQQVDSMAQIMKTQTINPLIENQSITSVEMSTTSLAVPILTCPPVLLTIPTTTVPNETTVPNKITVPNETTVPNKPEADQEKKPSNDTIDVCNKNLHQAYTYLTQIKSEEYKQSYKSLSVCLNMKPRIERVFSLNTSDSDLAIPSTSGVKRKNTRLESPANVIESSGIPNTDPPIDSPPIKKIRVKPPWKVNESGSIPKIDKPIDNTKLSGYNQAFYQFINDPERPRRGVVGVAPPAIVAPGNLPVIPMQMRKPVKKNIPAMEPDKNIHLLNMLTNTHKSSFVSLVTAFDTTAVNKAVPDDDCILGV